MQVSDSPEMVILSSVKMFSFVFLHLQSREAGRMADGYMAAASSKTRQGGKAEKSPNVICLLSFPS